MSRRNWARITTGAMFESLATTLIFFEDAGAALFGRPGKDGGQDARSSDGTLVYQAKHHQDASAAKAIADAKKEAAKIAKYRTAGHAREPQWRGVTRWRLVTNAAFNPTDRQTWDTDVVPLFKAQGLDADYWEQATLDGLLEKHPEVDRAYFENETRAFLSLPEVRELLPAQEPFLRRDELGAFVGRDAEIGVIGEFLDSDELFLLAHGPGGVGKTRMVIEAGERIAGEGDWQVLWANVASMEASGSWFDAIVVERPTLLIVDEPDDAQVLRVLVEQLGSRVGRLSRWKIAISVRSPKDPVLKFLFGPRLKHLVGELPIGVLPKSAAEEMCLDLIDSGPLAVRPDEWRNGAAVELAKRFSNHPVWLTLAVHCLESTGNLEDVPATAEGLAESYVDEVLSKQAELPPDVVRGLLRWVALVGPLNREDDTVIGILTQEADIKDASTTRAALARLVARRALSERGARNRLVELKPDVLRDHVLLKWLAVDVGYGPNPVQPSDAAKALAKVVLDAAIAGSVSAVGRSILVSLARTELFLGLIGRAVPLLDPFVHGLEQALGGLSASKRASLAELLVDVAPYRPEDVVRISSILRTSVCAVEHVEGLFGAREVSHDDVVLDLAWPVFHAALGARTAAVRTKVIRELCALAAAESDIAPRKPRGLPNDGRRATALVGRTLEGGPQFWSDFEDAAATVGSELLDELTDGEPSPGRLTAVKAVVGPAISVRRAQTWTEAYTFHVQTSTILPGHPAWTTRRALLDKIQTFLSRDDTPTNARVAVWSLFAESHRTVNQAQLAGVPEVQETMRGEMLAGLKWALSVLTGRSVPLDELSAARELWDWHVRFQEDPELREAAEALEALYSDNEVAGEFEWLLPRDEWAARGDRAVAKARELAELGQEAIEAFLERAAAFFESERELYQVLGVAWALGAHADQEEGVRRFVLTALAEPAVSARTDFAATAGNGWIAARRQGDVLAAGSLVVELVDACGSDSQKLNLLQRAYGRVPRPNDFGDPSTEELAFVRSMEGLFVDAQRCAEFIACVGWGVDYELASLKTQIERVLDATDNEHIDRALYTLVDALYWALRDRAPDAMPPDIGVWMLDQLLRVPDADSLGGTLEWHINEVLKLVGRPSVAWLPKALKRRRELEAQSGHGAIRAVSYHMRFSRFVVPIPSEGEIAPSVENAVRELLELISDEGSVGYYLHAVLRDVDPHGRVVPAEVAARFKATAERDAAWRLARIGGAFSVGTDAWRTIAKPVLERATTAAIDERRSLFAALGDHGIRSWSGAPGKVPAIFVDAVEAARQRLEEETDEVFRPLWKWRLELAEAELREEEERAKEERGE